jgi:translation elongation factor P/translation initiation factor 5A
MKLVKFSWILQVTRMNKLKSQYFFKFYNFKKKSKIILKNVIWQIKKLSPTNNDKLQTLLYQVTFKNVRVKLTNEEKITHSLVCHDIIKNAKF